MGQVGIDPGNPDCESYRNDRSAAPMRLTAQPHRRRVVLIALVILCSVLTAVIPGRPITSARDRSASHGSPTSPAHPSATELSAVSLGMTVAAAFSPLGGGWETTASAVVNPVEGARAIGPTGRMQLTKPIVGMAATPSGAGYWLVASDGGIFAFGDARFFGSTGAIHLNQPIVGMAATPSGAGYWLVASDGGIFAFGDARFFGSGASTPSGGQYVGIARRFDSDGYWLIGGDGKVTAFGDTDVAVHPGGPASNGPPTSTSNDPAIGISLADTLETETPAEIATELARIRSIGVTWIRVDLEWSGVQPTSASSYSWSHFDAIVAAANAKGLSVLPIIDYTPSWARPAGCTTEFCAPADPSAFGAFAGAAAARYAPKGVHHWEIWNEPNNTYFWQPEPSATAYATLVRAASSAIRLADPHAFIVSGGLAPESTSNGDISQLSFLTAFCAAGGPSYVDAIGYHAYSYPVTPTDVQSWNAWSQMDSTSPSVRSILDGCGAAAKKIWITEYGAPTNGPGVEATPSNYQFGEHPDHVSESLQALMATQSVQLVRNDPSIGALFWYTYEDSAVDPTTVESSFGLVTSNGTPKPAWSALRTAIAS